MRENGMSVTAQGAKSIGSVKESTTLLARVGSSSDGISRPTMDLALTNIALAGTCRVNIQ
jgi:hypothetical protein